MVLYQTNVAVNILFLGVAGVLLLRYLLVYHTALLLPWTNYDCRDECLRVYLAGPPNHTSPILVDTIRENFLIQLPSDPHNSTFEVDEPVWARLVDWNLVQENLKEVWEGQPPGVFVEVGATDGEFMSQTIVLERNLGWSGLLVEPDPRAFALLQEKRRGAWASPMCIHNSKPCSRRFWLRDIEEELPYHFKQLLMARSKLNDYTMQGDEERGKTIMVPCVALSSILLAANITTIDLFTTATGVDGDESRMADVIQSRKFDVKTMLIHYPAGRLFSQPYPHINGYILDMGHSTLQIKFYIRRSHCKLISSDECKKMKHYDSIDACLKYLCFNFLTVHSLKPSQMKTKSFR